MISIVFVGRNDNYGGDFDARLLSTTRHNTCALEARGIAYEIVFVEWNPLPNRRLLSELICTEFAAARCFVVDGEIHRLVSCNRHIAVLEYHAKNVGARMARGQWLLLTNPDNYLGREILDFLGNGPPDPDTLYRAGRINIDDAREIDAPDRIDPFRRDPPPFIQGSGDFALCSQHLFTRIGGFREDLAFTNTHKDSIFCHAVYDLTAKAQKIGKTFHLRHARDDATRRRIEYAWHQVPRTAQPTFGLEGVCVEEPYAATITRLRLRDELVAEAEARAVPHPRVPRAYRIPRIQRLKAHPLVRKAVNRIRSFSR